MSASLVGSEMCIRDSPRPKEGQPEADATDDDALDRLLLRNRRQGRRDHPVSYTHLTLPTICSV
eukprot:13436355-Alexandrium_andersonii.AAC.1